MRVICACICGLLLVLAALGCLQEENGNRTENQPPVPKDEGVLITEVPAGSDVIFASIRHVLEDLECLDAEYRLKPRFITDAGCNSRIYDPKGGLSARRQLYVMDLETKNAVQVTNIDCDFSSGQVVDSGTIMAPVACNDTNGDGKIGEGDQKEIYFIHLESGEMECLTCGSGLRGINNPDYSQANGLVVFSASNGTSVANPHHLYTADFTGEIQQLTNDVNLWDFDCSWSEDGSMIAFARMPTPPFEVPTQVWIMAYPGGELTQITEGGDNPQGEGPQGVYPIGIDVDPHISPDNDRIVFSRLKTAQENEPFGVYELVILDLDTREETVLDGSYANMLPEWKSGGILFIRQAGDTDPMEVSQGLYLYENGEFTRLEEYPFDVFPIGAYSASWID